MHAQQDLLGSDLRFPRAVISPCGRYRYLLTREWDPDRPTALLIMLNPSTADGVVNDATVSRQVRRLRMLGYGGLMIVNLFALRSPHPSLLRAATDPVGPDNDDWIRWALEQRPTTVIAGWGAHGALFGRAAKVESILARWGGRVMCLGQTLAGEPCHPLFLSYAIRLQPYERPPRVVN